MTRKIITAKPEFITAIKKQIEVKKERHMKIYSQISVSTSDKLRKMNAN